jgi:ligand-binding sensor domain-containing protein
MQDKKGMLWFGTRDGVYCYDRESFTRFPDNKKIKNKDSLHLKMVDCMLEDKSGNIWFASGMSPGDEGICRYNPLSGELTGYKPYGNGWIRTVTEDKDGNLYIASRHNGVCRYDPASGKFINFTAQAGINNSSITTILNDRKGNIWIATELGSGELGEDGGVWRFDGKTFAKFTTKEGLVHNGVFTIVEDQFGNIWFGTRNVGLCRYDGESFTRFSQ